MLRTIHVSFGEMSVRFFCPFEIIGLLSSYWLGRVLDIFWIQFIDAVSCVFLGSYVRNLQGFTGSLVVRIWHFNHCSLGSVPGLRLEILHQTATCCGKTTTKNPPKTLPNPRSWKFTSVFSYKSFVVLPLKFRSVSWFFFFFNIWFNIRV